MCECPYCGAELVYDDTFGVGNIAAQDKYGYGWNKLGTIYRCPNHGGFSCKEDAEDYAEYIAHLDLESYCKQYGLDSWEEVVCDSSCHNVSGCFYMYEDDGELREGYPC